MSRYDKKRMTTIPKIYKNKIKNNKVNTIKGPKAGKKNTKHESKKRNGRNSEKGGKS